MVTKVEAIKKVLEELGGIATWEQIYNNIEKYYHTAKSSIAWKEGIRGVLYREIKKGRYFKKVGLGIYALEGYKEEPKPTPEQKQRMHSYMEGICLEIGKFKGFHVYTPDKTSLFKDNIYLKDIITLESVPPFTYPQIIKQIKNIDVMWFNCDGFQFPQRVFEVVDTIETLTEALNRCVQLLPFNVCILIVGPLKYKNRFLDKINREPYLRFRKMFDYKDYGLIEQLYENSIRQNKIEKQFFKSSVEENYDSECLHDAS